MTERQKKEEIGSTSLQLEAINAIGETLILQFGDYRRNCQTFTDIFVQIVCDVESKAFSSPSIQNFIANSILAFPLTTIGGSIIHIHQAIRDESYQETQKGTFVGRYG